MKMRLLIPLLLIAVSLSAQEKSKKRFLPKKDSTKVRLLDSSKMKKVQPADIYRMPTSKPKNPSVFTQVCMIKEKIRPITKY